MATPTFAIDARVLSCRGCSAPLVAPVGGGDVRCEYCEAVNRVAPRPPLGAGRVGPAAPQAPTAAQAQQQRLFLLHQQAATYDAAASPYSFYQAPPGLEAVGARVASKGFGDEGSARMAEEAFRRAVAELEARPGDPAAERRCSWLAVLQSQIWMVRGDPLRQRAALETAEEVLRDPGHRHLVYAELAKAARSVGDLDAAEAWLAQCDPNAMVLDLDSAYRVAASSIALVRGRPERALEVVGRRPGEVPFGPAESLVAAVIRAAALESLGQQVEAEAALAGAASAHGRADVARVLEKNQSVAAARATFDRLQAKGALPRGPVKVGRFLVKGAGLVGCITIVAPVVLTVLGLVFSPLLCSGMGSCMGYQDEVMSRLRSCPAAAAALGDDIRPAVVGFSCGNAETSGSSGNASWRMPVTGSRASGVYEFHAVMTGGRWRLISGTVTVSGQTIDIGSCAAAPPLPVAWPPSGQPFPGQPVAPSLPAPAGSACQRMAACCAVAGGHQGVSGMCQSLPSLQMIPNPEPPCAQMLDAARRTLEATQGSAPPQCQ